MREEVLQPLQLFLRKVRCAARLRRQQQLHHKKHLEAQARRAAAANAAATAVAAAAADSLVGHLQPQVSRLLRERTSCVGRWQFQQQHEGQLKHDQRQQQCVKAASVSCDAVRYSAKASGAQSSTDRSSSSTKRCFSVKGRLTSPLTMQSAAFSLRHRPQHLEHMQQQQPLRRRSLKLVRSRLLEVDSSSTDDDTVEENIPQKEHGDEDIPESSLPASHKAEVAATLEAVDSDASETEADGAAVAADNSAARLPQSFYGDSDAEASSAPVATVTAPNADFLRSRSTDTGTAATTPAARERISAARAFLASEAKIHRRLLLACRRMQQQQRLPIASANTFFTGKATAPAAAAGAPAVAAVAFSQQTRRLGTVGEAPGAAAAAAARGIKALHIPAASPCGKGDINGRTPAAAAVAAKQFLSRQRTCHSAVSEGERSKLGERSSLKQQQHQHKQQQEEQQQQASRLLCSRRTIGSSARRAVSLTGGHMFCSQNAEQQ